MLTNFFTFIHFYVYDTLSYWVLIMRYILFTYSTDISLDILYYYGINHKSITKLSSV